MAAECREEHLKEFEVYDTTVDVVSAWEANLNYIYANQFPNFYFDRFPELEIGNRTLTPDFTVFFDRHYGLIGEIKRTFPNSKEAIFTELDQLESYDERVGIQDANGNFITPEICDILLIIEGSSAPQMGTRLQSILSEGEEIDFEKNLVLIRYQFNQDATISRYEFQRVTQLEVEFRDDGLEADDTLSEIMGEKSDYETLNGYPKHFNSFKARKPLCNDTPPGPYLATVLWHKILPSYLTEEEFEVWQATNGQKVVPISVTVAGLKSQINDYMHDGRAKAKWIQRALEFLVGANLATTTGEDDEDEYEIRFMGLVQDVGKGNIQEGTQELEQRRELANKFIRRFCEDSENGEELEIARVAEGEQEEEPDETTSQAGLDDFE